LPTTADRLWCLPLAIRWFQAQSYEGDLELIVISEDAAELRELVEGAGDDRIELVYCTPDVPLGGKHELAAEVARFPWLAKWDDDDWQSPLRLERTMRHAEAAGAEMVSAEPLLFYELGGGRCFEYRYALLQKWQPGNSMIVARNVWERVRFKWHLARGVDTDFVGRALASGVDGVIVEDAPLTVVMRHGQTTGLATWQPEPPEWRLWDGDLEGLMGADLRLFEEAFCEKPATSRVYARPPGTGGPFSPGPPDGSSDSATETATS